MYTCICMYFFWFKINVYKCIDKMLDCVLVYLNTWIPMQKQKHRIEKKKEEGPQGHDLNYPLIHMK